MPHQGRFKPSNTKKYVGDVNNIFYRSGIELNFMLKLDKNPDVLYWQSEECVVPYYDPSSGKYRRYFPDFLVKFKNGTTAMIEIKCVAETHQPKMTKGKNKKKFLRESMTYETNNAKWKFATEYCKERGWQFMIITERDLGIKY
jgi:hypothetical protein